jgi:hypothetical protein
MSLCFNWAPRHEVILGNGNIAPRILDLGTLWWRWVVSFTPRPLNPQGKSPSYPLDRKLGGPHSRSGNGGEKKIPSPYRDSNPEHPARSPALYHWAIPAPPSHRCICIIIWFQSTRINWELRSLFDRAVVSTTVTKKQVAKSHQYTER